MRVAIISNLAEGKGLAADARILDRLLTAWGHDVLAYDFRAIGKDTCRANLVIHLEAPYRKAIWWSDRHWLLPNPDWLPGATWEWMPMFERVLAKTHDGVERLAKVAPRVEYLGFESEDRYQRRVKKERRFFHSWCGSIVKGSRALLRCWDRQMYLYPHDFFTSGKASLADYQRAQNRCLFWIQPSAVEGFGHCIHEGLSVGAIVATTDAPPMNESPGIAFRIKARKVGMQNLAQMYDVMPNDIGPVLEQMWSLSDAEVADLSGRARAAWEHGRDEFRARLQRLLETEP